MTFKQGFNAHQQSIRYKNYQHSMALSKYAWLLKEKKATANKNTMKKATTNQNTMKRCNLCLAEKIKIIKADKNKSLNKQTKLVSKCRDENASYLRKFRQVEPPLLVFTSSHLYWHPQYFQDFPGRLQALSGLLALFSTFLSGLLAH